MFIAWYSAHTIAAATRSYSRLNGNRNKVAGIVNAMTGSMPASTITLSMSIAVLYFIVRWLAAL